MSLRCKFAQVSSVFAGISLRVVLLLACGAQASPGERLDAALRLLPKRPDVLVVDSSDSRTVAAATAWGTRSEQVRAFSLNGQSTVYINRSVDPYRCAGQKNQICVLLLAALIWHEAAHLDGDGEEQAQLREEALFRQFVAEHRVEFAAGQGVLRAMAARRAPRSPSR